MRDFVRAILALETIVLGACNGSAADFADVGAGTGGTTGDASTDSVVGSDGTHPSTDAPIDSACSDVGGGWGSWRRCTVDADCHGGRRCVEIFANGWRSCLPRPEVATTCPGGLGSIVSECGCDGGECRDGEACFAIPDSLGNVTNYCMEGCRSDSDCAAGEVCLRPGASGPVGKCTPANCRADDQCARCQLCEIVFSPSLVSIATSLSCTCASDRDCASGQRCVEHRGVHGAPAGSFCE